MKKSTALRVFAFCLSVLLPIIVLSGCSGTKNEPDTTSQPPPAEADPTPKPSPEGERPIVDTVFCDFDGDGVQEPVTIRCALDYSQYNHLRQYTLQGREVTYSGPDIVLEFTCGDVEYAEALDEIVIQCYLGAEAVDLDGDGGEELIVTADTGGSGGCISIAVLTFADGVVRQVLSPIHQFGFSARGKSLPGFELRIDVEETGFTQTIPMEKPVLWGDIVYDEDTGTIRYENGQSYESEFIHMDGIRDVRLRPEQLEIAQCIWFMSHSNTIGFLISELRFTKNGYEVVSQSILGAAERPDQP